MRQHFLSLPGAGSLHMSFDHMVQLLNIRLCLHLFNGNHFFIQIFVQIIFLVQHIGNTTAHSCSKVLARFSQHDHTSTGHIFTAVLSHALYYSTGA